LDTRVSCAAEEAGHGQLYLHRFREGSFPRSGDAPASSYIPGDHGSGCKKRAGLAQPQHLDPSGRASRHRPQPWLPKGSGGSWGQLGARPP